VVQYPQKSRVRWQGNSLEVLRSFPDAVKQNIGGDLSRLESGDPPLDSKPMGSVLPGVSELRDQYGRAWYRLLYIPRGGLIFVLHCFQKKTNQTEQKDIETARERLKVVNETIAVRKKKNAKK
jgi:phage-related protein